MDVKLLNPFVEAAVEVIKKEVGTDVRRGDLSLARSALTTDDLTVLIHMVGEVYGVVLYGMPQSTALGMVSKILDQEFTEMDSLAQSGIAELGNVITGSATVKFSQAGYQSNISPPTIISGKGVQIATLDFPRIIVPLQTGLGSLVVHLALKENLSGHETSAEDFVSLVVPTAPKTH